MPTHPLSLRTGRAPPDWLFDESGGIQISGDSGSGKSTLMALLAVLLARLGYGFSLFDPHSDLARKVYRLCLALGPSVARRVHFICPGDTRIVTKLNPLAVDASGLDVFTARAMLTEKCGHMAQILLHAFGEEDFNSKPLMYKWVTLILRTTALLGLPFAAVRHFLLDIGSPLYHALVAAVPDFVAQLEFGALADLRPREREEFIASTKNRMLGFLSNPIVEAALSSTGGVLQPRHLLRRECDPPLRPGDARRPPTGRPRDLRELVAL